MALFQLRIRREPLRNLLVEIFNYIVLYDILFFEYYVNTTSMRHLVNMKRLASERAWFLRV
jgi:hypothetical protein